MAYKHETNRGSLFKNEKKEPPKDAEKWQNIENKFEKYNSEKPGS